MNVFRLIILLNNNNLLNKEVTQLTNFKKNIWLR